jgi:hypothetical protein
MLRIRHAMPFTIGIDSLGAQPKDYFGSSLQVQLSVTVDIVKYHTGIFLLGVECCHV